MEGMYLGHLQQRVIELDFEDRKWAFYYIQKW